MKGKQNQSNVNIADSLSINSLSIESKSNSFIDLIRLKSKAVKQVVVNRKFTQMRIFFSITI